MTKKMTNERLFQEAEKVESINIRHSATMELVNRFNRKRSYQAKGYLLLLLNSERPYVRNLTSLCCRANGLAAFVERVESSRQITCEQEGHYGK
jgi:hypothetical protein